MSTRQCYGFSSSPASTHTPDWDNSFPIDDAGPFAIEFHAAERATLVEIADRIGRKHSLFGKGMLAKAFGAPGRAVAEVVCAVVVPPRAFVVGSAIQNLKMDVGMLETDPAEQHEIFGLEPDRQPAMIQRFVAEIANPNARHLEPVLVGVERTYRLTEHLANAVAAVRSRRHIGAYPVMARVETNRMV